MDNKHIRRLRRDRVRTVREQQTIVMSFVFYRQAEQKENI